LRVSLGRRPGGPGAPDLLQDQAFPLRARRAPKAVVPPTPRTRATLPPRAPRARARVPRERVVEVRPARVERRDLRPVRSSALSTRGPASASEARARLQEVSRGMDGSRKASSEGSPPPRGPRTRRARRSPRRRRSRARAPAREGGSECTVGTRVGATVGEGGRQRELLKVARLLGVLRVERRERASERLRSQGGPVRDEARRADGGHRWS